MRRSAGPLLLAAAAAVLTWRISLTPRSEPNIDGSWVAGLYVAARNGMNFGPDLAFVYGPLGFLSFPALYYSGPAMLATLASGLAYFAALAMVARLLWRRLGPAWATALTLLAASATSGLNAAERVEAIFVLLCLGIVLDDRSELGRGQVAGLAGLTALMALVKISAGAVMLALLCVMLALPALRRRPRGEIAALAGTALAALALVGGALWLLSGQSLWDIPGYLRNAREVIVGNADSVSDEQPGLGSDYTLAAVGVGALAVAGWFALRPLRRANQVAGAALLALYTWVAFRHGFTRHDEGHTPLFFAPLVLILAALVPFRRAAPAWGRAQTVQALAVAVAAVALGSGAMGSRSFGDLFRLSTVPTVDAVTTLGSTEKRVRLRDGTRVRLQAAYGLTPALLNRVSGQTVHVDPWEAGMVWAYQSLRWRPAPLFQSFTAYTSGLDDLNADFLASARAPRYVLHQNIAADERNARFESPRYMEELLCRYRQVDVDGIWQLLERGRDRCGEPLLLEQREVRLGDAVRVPQAGRDDLVVATFRDLRRSAWQRLRGLVFKRSQLRVRLGRGRVDRFLPGHAGNPHVMKVPACLGYHPALLDRSPYPSVALDQDGGGSGNYDLRVYRVPFDC